MEEINAETGDRWVFGYGSLMWRPDFDYVECRPGRLNGYHRSLCVYSWVHRGTAARPGLVLGLDRGGRCRGVGFRIAHRHWPEVHRYLQAREQVTKVYRERVLPMHLGDGRRVNALCYVVDRRHEQYAGGLSPEAQAQIVIGAHGQSGANRDYVLNTLSHLDEMDIVDAALERVGDLLYVGQAR